MANRNGGRLSTTVLINKQIKCNTMKKEQIIVTTQVSFPEN